MLQTERLILKPLSPEDEYGIYRIMADENVKQTYLVPDFPSVEAGLKTARRLIAISADEKHCILGIYLEGVLIGLINDVEWGEDSVEMGYVIASDYQKRGYATEAFRAVIPHLFERGLKKVIAGAFATNLASIRVMEKCGMTKIQKKAEIEYRGKLHRCVYYAIKASE
jgi:RimJ/RimL family protein N-acetyltransferase